MIWKLQQYEIEIWATKRRHILIFEIELANKKKIISIIEVEIVNKKNNTWHNSITNSITQYEQARNNFNPNRCSWYNLRRTRHNRNRLDFFQKYLELANFLFFFFRLL